MMLDVKGVARLLSVSEKTIYRWLAKQEIPAFKIGETYRFNRVELLEWSTARKIRVAPEIFAEAFDADVPLPSLADALRCGGIHYRIYGTDKRTTIRAIVDTISLPEDIDRQYLHDALMARENLGTTAIGDGIAIPHVRNPIIFHIHKPVLSLCFLEKPVDFGALDNRPVDTVFTIITNTIRSHLHILSRLSFALHRPDVRGVITSASSREMILETLENLERALKPGAAVS